MHRLNGGLQATVVEVRGNQEEDQIDESPSVTEEDIKIVLGRSGLRTVIDVAVSSISMLIDECIISALQSDMTERRASPIEAEVSTSFARIIKDQIGENMMSELGKNAESQAVTSKDVILTATHGCIGYEEPMLPILCFVPSSLDKEAV